MILPLTEQRRRVVYVRFTVGNRCDDIFVFLCTLAAFSTCTCLPFIIRGPVAERKTVLADGRKDIFFLFLFFLINLIMADSSN